MQSRIYAVSINQGDLSKYVKYSYLKKHLESVGKRLFVYV